MWRDEFQESLHLVIVPSTPKLPFLCTLLVEHTVFTPFRVPTTQAQTFERVY